jgi:hypothetical protein
MEIPRMIIEELQRLEFLEYDKNKINIEIIYSESIKYTIQITPNNKGVTINYKGLKFKCETINEYTKIYKYIIKQIDRETFNLVNYRYEYELDEEFIYNKHIIIIKKQNDVILYNEYTGDNITITSDMHLPYLFYITK